MAARHDEQIKRVLITGATSGVGRAVLHHYFREGAEVIAVNRRRLPELESEYPGVRFEHLDVRDPVGVSAFMNELFQANRIPDLFVLNAGINLIDNDQQFVMAQYKSVVETNLYGVLHFVEAISSLPRRDHQIHVVAISSMASYIGNPYGLGYHTSKKALSACFDVWSKMFADTDLVFQQVMLGPVSTGIFTMEEQLPRWMVNMKELFSTTAAETAQAIAQFAKTKRPRLFFPFRAVPLYLGMGLAQSLIPSLFRGRKTLSGEVRRQKRPRDGSPQVIAMSPKRKQRTENG